MGVACALNERSVAVVAGALLLTSLSLGGCATSPAGSSVMDARAEAPAPKTSAYAPLGDPPLSRANRAMTSNERTKLKQELLAARDHQAATAKGQTHPAPKIREP